MSLYKRGLGVIVGADEVTPDPETVRKYPAQWLGIALIQDGTYEGTKIEKIFVTEDSAMQWYGEITASPNCLYASYWDMWGISWWSEESPGKPAIAEHFKSPKFVESGRPEPLPKGADSDILITQPGVKVTVEKTPLHEEVEMSASPPINDDSHSMLLIGGGLVAGGLAMVALSGKKKRRKV